MQFWEKKLNQVLVTLGVMTLLFPLIATSETYALLAQILSYSAASIISIATAFYLGLSPNVSSLRRITIFPVSWWGVSMVGATIYMASSKDLSVGISHLMAMFGCTGAYYLSFVSVRNQIPGKQSTILLSPSAVIGVALFLHTWIVYLASDTVPTTPQIIGFVTVALACFLFSTNFVIFTYIPHWAFALTLVFSGSMVAIFTLQVRSQIDGLSENAQQYGGQWFPLLTILFLISLFNTPSLAEMKWLVAKDRQWLRIIPPVLVMLLLLATVFPLSRVRHDDIVAISSFIAILVLYTIYHMQSIFKQREILHELNIVSRTDSLTLVPNRLAILNHIIKLGRTTPETYVIVFGINRFKQVNTHAGPAMGDKILQQVSKVGSEIAANYNALIGRLGGDEFAILLSGKRTDALGCAEDLSNEFVALSSKGHFSNMHVQVSIGLCKQSFEWTHDQGLSWWEEASVTKTMGYFSATHVDFDTFPGSGDPMDSASQAVQAMRFAKSSNIAIAWYSFELEAVEKRNLVMENRLQIALEEEKVDTYFQPIVDLATGHVSSIEALSRWRDDELGNVGPVEFIPVAERSGLIEKLGWLTIKRTLELLASVSHHSTTYTCSVNVSPIQLRSHSFPSRLNEMVEQSGVDRHSLIIEVTEGIFIDTEDPAVATVDELSSFGYRIALDDFGTGWSSWSRMSKLPVDIIKIDRSLTVNINDTRGLAVVKSIVDMSNSLDLSVIAEGIETKDVCDKITSLGAALGQGWLWAKAVPKNELIELLERQEAGDVINISTIDR